jgi:hypothetical protein
MGEMRKCGRCGELKPIEQFAWRRKRKRRRDNMCAPCRSAYGREHYLANRQKYIDAEARRKRERAEARTKYLIEFFRSHPCADCGESDPVVLEFDHLRDKRFEVTNQFASRNWQEILDEISKCEVVCANCHKRRTAVGPATCAPFFRKGQSSTDRTYNRPAICGRGVNGRIRPFQGRGAGSIPVARFGVRFTEINPSGRGAVW